MANFFGKSRMDRLNEAQIEAVQLLKNIFPRISHDAITSKVLTSPQPDVNAIIDAILAEPSTSSRDAAGPSWADSEQPPVKKAKVEPEGGEEDSKTRVDDISRELQALLPDVDPSFLARKAAELASHPPQALNDFILSCLEDPKSLPGKPKVPAQVGLLGLEIKPVVQLSVEEIIDKFKPDPRTYFYDVTTMTSYKHEDNALEYLKHKFPRHSVNDIRRCLRKSKGHYVPALKELTSLPPTLKVKRNHRPIPDALCEESFLLELNFAEKEAEVVHIIESEKQKRLSALQEGAVFECQCCFEEVLLLDAFECEEVFFPKKMKIFLEFMAFFHPGTHVLQGLCGAWSRSTNGRQQSPHHMSGTMPGQVFHGSFGESLEPSRFFGISSKASDGRNQVCWHRGIGVLPRVQLLHHHCQCRGAGFFLPQPQLLEANLPIVQRKISHSPEM